MGFRGPDKTLTPRAIESRLRADDASRQPSHHLISYGRKAYASLNKEMNFTKRGAAVSFPDDYIFTRVVLPGDAIVAANFGVVTATTFWCMLKPRNLLRRGSAGYAFSGLWQALSANMKSKAGEEARGSLRHALPC